MGRGWLVVPKVTGAALTVLAQGLSSISNFAVPALALQAGDLAAFGHFSIAFQAGQLVIVVGQGALADSVLVHASHAEDERATRVRDGAGGAAVVFGLLAGLCVAGAALFAGDGIRLPLLLVALGSPALVAQYSLRARLMSMGNVVGVVRADALWLGVVLAAAAADALGWWDSSPNGYLAVWLVGALISAAPELRAALRHGAGQIGFFWSTAGPQSLRMGTEAALARSVFIISLLATEMILDSSASGALAAAVLVMSPITLLHTTASVYYVPRLVRRYGIHVPPLRPVLRIALGGAVITLAWASLVAIVNVLGSPLGPFDLEANGITTGLFAATVVRFVALAVWRGPLIAMRVADATHHSLSARVVGTVAQTIFPIVGLLLGELVGGAIGLAIGAWLGALAAWWAWASLGERASVRSAVDEAMECSGDPGSPPLD